MESAAAQVNGLQLMGHLEKRPSLAGLNNRLFPSGLLPREVVEITGDTALGKTYILTDLIARCILPTTVICREREIRSGGLGVDVFFLDLDHHFDVFRLVRIMEVRLKIFLKNIEHVEVDKIITSSLKRLVMLHVYSDEDLAPSLLTVRNYICSNVSVSLVAMDSIGSHYWKNVAANGKRKMDSYVDDILYQVHRTLGAFQVSFVYTRPAAFASKSSALPTELAAVFDLRHANTKIKLKQHKKFKLAEVHSRTNTQIVNYDICENGIEWSKM